MKIGLIVPAAGASQRYGGGDKLAQDLGGRPLLLRTVEAFTRRDEVQHIVVAGPPDDFESFREKYGPALSFHGAQVVPGGKSARWETVKAALESIPDDCTHIAVHDAARPAASNDLLSRIFEAAKSVAAVIPGVPVNSTLKRVAAEAATLAGEDADDAVASAILGDAGRVKVSARQVTETLDRENVIAVQTPQVFEADLLRRAYAQDSLEGATDDASLVERLGETVYVVEGDPTNIKVTTQADMKLIRAILGVKPPAERPVHKRF